jgi:hypothetical protein
LIYIGITKKKQTKYFVSCLGRSIDELLSDKRNERNKKKTPRRKHENHSLINQKKKTHTHNNDLNFSIYLNKHDAIIIYIIDFSFFTLFSVFCLKIDKIVVRDISFCLTWVTWTLFFCCIQQLSIRGFAWPSTHIKQKMHPNVS